MENLDIGDLGAFDPAFMAFDIPLPTPADEAAMESADVSASVVSSTAMIEASEGFAGNLVSTGTDMTPPPAFDAPMSADAESLSLGAIPEVTPDLTDPAGAAYSEDGGGYESPSAFSSMVPPAFSDAPLTSDPQSFGLGGLAPIGLPMAPMSPFAGASLPPEEAFDLSMALAPPEPSQEGFAGASDAPMSSTVSAWAPGVGEYAGVHRLHTLEAMSIQALGPLGGDAPAGAPGGRSGGIVIQNLHLPAAKAADAMNELLAMSTGTEADLSGIA